MGLDYEQLFALGTNRTERKTAKGLEAVADVLCGQLGHTPDEDRLIHLSRPQGFWRRYFSHGVQERNAHEVMLHLLENNVRYQTRTEVSRTFFQVDVDTPEQRDNLPKGVFIHRTPKIHAPQTIALSAGQTDGQQELLSSLGYHQTLDQYDPDPRAYRIIQTTEGTRLRMNPMRTRDFNRFSAQMGEFTRFPVWQLRVNRARVSHQSDAELLGAHLREHLDPAQYTVFVARSMRQFPKRHVEYVVGVRSAEEEPDALRTLKVLREDGSALHAIFRAGHKPESRKEYADPAGLDKQTSIFEAHYKVFHTIGSARIATRTEAKRLMQLLERAWTVFDLEFFGYDETNPDKGSVSSSQFARNEQGWLHTLDCFQLGINRVRGATVQGHARNAELLRETGRDMMDSDILLGVNILPFDIRNVKRRLSTPRSQFIADAIASVGRPLSGSELSTIDQLVSDAAEASQGHQKRPFDHVVILDMLFYAKNHRHFRGGNSVEAMAFAKKIIDYNEQRELYLKALKGDVRAARKALLYARNDLILEHGIGKSFLPAIAVDQILSGVSLHRIAYLRHDRLMRHAHLFRAYERFTHLDSGARSRSESIDREEAQKAAREAVRTIPLSKARSGVAHLDDVHVYWNPLLLKTLRELHANNPRSRLAASLIRDIKEPSTKAVALQALEEVYSGLIEHTHRGALLREAQPDLFGNAQAKQPSLAHSLAEPLGHDEFYANHREQSTGFLAKAAPQRLNSWLARRFGLPDDFSLYRLYESLVRSYQDVRAQPWLAQREHFLIASNHLAEQLRGEYGFMHLGRGNVALLEHRMAAALDGGPLFLSLQFPKKDITAQTDLISALQEGTKPAYKPVKTGMQQAYAHLRLAQARARSAA